MHPTVARAIQEIDAALYNGDTFEDPDDRAELTAYVEKWAQELGLIPSKEDEEDEPEEVEVVAPVSGSSEGLKALGEVGAGFIRSQLRRPSALMPVLVRADGAWRDDRSVVHAVNASWLASNDIDLGRETACGSMAWDPDNPRDYPTMINAVVDCMACVVRQARLCP